MAKKKATRKRSGRKVNKSEAIRDYIAKHPSAGPTEVSTALKKKGIAVTPAYVSGVKNSQKSNASKKRRAPSRKKRKDTSPVEDVVQAGQLLYQAVDLVMRAGAKEAKAMVEMAGKMVERMSDEDK